MKRLNPPSSAPSSAVVETHTAVLFFMGDRVYKFKKPVLFDFLDFRSIEARRNACKREVELNSRLCKDVYLGVGVLQLPGCDSEPVVVMRRLPEERRLSTLIAEGADVAPALKNVAQNIALLHEQAERSYDLNGPGSDIEVFMQWRANISELFALGDEVVPERLVKEVDELGTRFITDHIALFAKRTQGGFIRDGHGDLLADDIFCLDDGVRILDCLDFDDRLRWGDVLADIAFLAMDLERLGREDLAEEFLGAYERDSSTQTNHTLLDFYIAYRATVRAKVAAIRFLQSDEVQKRKECEDLMTIANQHLQAANARLILIGGLPGSGKSTLARRLGEEMNCRVISSDLVRKELVGLEPWEHAPAEWQKGIYSPQHTLDTYSQMLDDATDCISKGRSVILDASWSDPSMRDRAAKVAEQTGAEIISILCVASAMEISRRLSKRGKTGSGVSDANLKIAVRMSQGVDTWPAAWRLDTTGNEEEAFEKLVGVIKGDFGAAQSVTGV